MINKRLIRQVRLRAFLIYLIRIFLVDSKILAGFFFYFFTESKYEKNALKIGITLALQNSKL